MGFEICCGLITFWFVCLICRVIVGWVCCVSLGACDFVLYCLMVLVSLWVSSFCVLVFVWV